MSLQLRAEPVKTHSLGEVGYLLVVTPVSLVSGNDLLLVRAAQEQAELPPPLVDVGHGRRGLQPQH